MKPESISTFQLAIIAALLVNRNGGDVKTAAKEASQLWVACDQELQTGRIQNEKILSELIEKNMEVRYSGLKGVRGELPKSWPCSFDKALQLVMPKKRTRGDRYNLFRLFLRGFIQADHGSRHSKKVSGSKSKALSEKRMLDEIETIFKAFKQCEFSDIEDYRTSLELFSQWLCFREAEQICAQRTQAAKARWGKKRGIGGQNQSS